jgi:predicted Zn-dependent protease
MIVRPELARFGDLAQAGMSLLFLRFGRDAERQADDLGLRYMTKQDYDPRDAIEVFSMLDRVGEASGEGRLPAWLSTHPAPEDRAQRIQAAIQQQGLAGTKEERREYLGHVEGMVFGDNPREGFFEGSTFYHPELRFRLQFPQGWKGQNQKQAVGATSPQEDAIVVLTLAPGTSAEQAASQFLSQQGLRAGGAQRTSVQGLPAVTAVFQAATEQTVIAGRVVFLEYDGKVYRLLGYTPNDRFSAYDRVFSASLGSFGPLSDRRYIDVQPKRVKVVEIARPTTVSELHREQRATVTPEVLALINHVPTGGTLPPGPVKVVVGGRLPGEAR